jgi:hypothetical protein
MSLNGVGGDAPKNIITVQEFMLPPFLIFLIALKISTQDQ